MHHHLEVRRNEQQSQWSSNIGCYITLHPRGQSLSWCVCARVHFEPNQWTKHFKHCKKTTTVPQAPPTPTNTTTRQSSTTLLQSTICSRLCTTHEPSHPPKMHRELVSLWEKEKEGARESEHISERAASWAACHWSSASSALRTVARAASLVRRAQSNITSALWCIVQSKEVHRLPFRRPTYCRSLHTNISNECWNSVYVFRNQEARSLVPDV